MLKQLCGTGLAVEQWLESAAMAFGWYVIVISFSAIFGAVTCN